MCVESFRISPKVDSVAESVRHVSFERTLDPPVPDHSTYEAVFTGGKPLAVDCTQPGVICKFPLVITGEEPESFKPAKQVKEVPIVRGVQVSDRHPEAREEKEELINEKEVRVPIYKGAVEVETVDDGKDSEDTWILEKNTANRKVKIPVKLVPSKQHDHFSAPVFPMHHDFHDHFNGEDPYHVLHRHGLSGWTPWMRAYPSVYNYPSNNHPCQPPVYHQPPPCSSGVFPTKKPTINIDDKIDKEED